MAAGGVQVQVLWSPNETREFATYSNELRLYSVLNTEDQEHQPLTTDIPLSERHTGRLLAVYPEAICQHQYQTVSWQPNQDRTHFFAVGQANGKVSLVNLAAADSIVGSQNLALVPRTLGRQCTCVVWNPNDTHLLAQGLEKARQDSSLIVWDVTRAKYSSSPEKSRHSSGFHVAPDAGSVDDTAKFYETGHSEVTNSIVWLPGQVNCLVAGMQTRFLKIFDIRDSHVAKQTHPPREYAQHKAIYGICVDPFAHHQLASYAEGMVYIWDIRSFNRPIYSLQRQGNNIVRLTWCPTRAGCLSILTAEDPFLRLVTIPYLAQSPDNPTDTSDIYSEYLSTHLQDRCPLSTKGQTQKGLTGISWHPTITNTALTANSDGVVRELVVADKMPLTWSAAGSLLFGSSEKLFSATSELKAGMMSGNPDSESSVDIATTMMERVTAGYGFNASHNCSLVLNIPSLHRVWSWLSNQVSSAESTDQSRVSVQGVNTVLEALFTAASSSQRSVLATPPVSVYISSQRQTAIELCGWNFSKSTEAMDEYFRGVEVKDEFERAAAIAVFYGELSRAISILKEGAGVIGGTAGNLFYLIALSLSGYSSQAAPLWQETCSGIMPQISSPYLRVVFAFLCASDHDSYNGVLEEETVMLQDRVAFACRFLDDQQLQDYLAHLTQQMVTNGVIEGLFLTGLNREGIRLLSNYVNKTGDVQTACLIASHVLPSMVKDKVVISWYQSYRNLLDQWHMWKERALFDTKRRQLDPTFKPAKQAAVMCTFCSKAITSDILRQDRFHVPGKGSATKSTCCPNCKKPLPRCALCLMHMAAGSVSKGRGNGSNLSDQFGQWFTWCQSCRHGGHAVHMAEWFKTHQECPVTDCSCCCCSLDPL